MNYHNVSFLASYGLSKQLPPSKQMEVAFAGRSNVGKSSLINKLLGRKALARVSAVPGKTARGGVAGVGCMAREMDCSGRR